MATLDTSFPAIGTKAHLLVTDPAELREAATLLREFLADLDLTCSRFRDDSELSILNSRGVLSDVDPLLMAAVRVALDAAEETDGLVDPTLGAAMISIGYDRGFADLPRVSRHPVATRSARKPAAPRSWREITIDPATATITLPPRVRLDLGATAKAWAADVAATQIAERLGCGALVNLGGDLAIAGPAPAGGWGVRVTADHAVGSGGQVVTMRSGGLATSSTTVRTWRRADQVLHHVLDPATGMPAKRVWRYVSVAAPTCVAANTAATAAIVLGARAPEWLAERDLAARLVAADGTVTAVAGWPADRCLYRPPGGGPPPPLLSTVEVGA